MFDYRRRRLISSSLKRSIRWEFWPIWLFYMPVVVYIAWLSLRHRGLVFSAVNPCMEDGGFVGESKSSVLLPLQESLVDKVALTSVVPLGLPLKDQCQYVREFMSEHQLTYPIILKPDVGQRGADVAVIESDVKMQGYLKIACVDTIVQEYIPGVEFGVFYIRRPEEAKGSIYSITHKCFPFVIGDGEKTLEQLILSHPRLHYMAHFLLDQHRERLYEIPKKNEQVDVVRLGSHCRGSLFLDGKAYYTPELESVVDRVSQQLHGFYFGRYDIRAASIEAFQRGEIKVIELNGVTSESTNIYDPKNSIVTAYRILMKQWKIAFEIGSYHVDRGQRKLGFFEMLKKAFAEKNQRVLEEGNNSSSLAPVNLSKN